ncbi:TPPC5 protein, partial [Odontophorus gujanensis]|nr:TPPC5 protein [Odontophorus gujanensis]
FTRGKSPLLERPLCRPRGEVSLSAFALLFCELVQYCQRRVYSVAELQAKLAQLGHQREPLVNTFISVPRENSTLNCAAFSAGLVEAVLGASGFPAKVTAHWHKGTTLMIKFEEGVIAREKSLEGR